MSALCVLAYAVLAVLAFLPVSPFATRVLPVASSGNPAGSDPLQMTWFLQWTPYALTHGLSLFHTNFIDYPTGVNLADNTTVPALGILGWPITATLGPVATFNFLIRLAFLLSATSMFFVMRRWCRSWQAPFAAGLLYAFGPYTAAQELHLDLVFVAIMPLLVLLADELLRRQRMRWWLLGLCIGLALACQYLISPDVFSGVAVLSLLAAVGLGIRYRREVRARLPYMAKAAVVAAAAFAVLAGLPIVEMVVGAGHLHGPVISESALQRTRADLLGGVVPTSNQLAAPSFISWLGNYFVDGNLSENGSYLGIPLLAVLFVIIRRLRRDATVVTFSLLAGVAWVLSLGSYLVIGTWRSPLAMPGYLYTRLPLLDNTIPARYSLFVLLFASMVLAIGIDRLWVGAVDPADAPPPVDPTKPEGAIRRLARAGTRRTRIAVVTAIVVVSLLPAVPFASRGLYWSKSLPTTISKVVPPGTVVLTFPFATPAATQPMAWQAEAAMRWRLMGGYANIDVPGQSVGQRWPLLLAPVSVQELLSYVESHDRYPEPPRVDAAVEAQLRTYLTKYHVGAVVLWRRQPDLGFYSSYLEQALGKPQVNGAGFSIWLPHHGQWGTARA